MKLTKLLSHSVWLASLLFACNAAAITLPPVPTEPIYFEPPVQKIPDTVRKQSCVTLDNAISYLEPYTYTYKPSYYKDGFNKFAASAVTFDFVPVFRGWLGLGFLGYSALVDEKEQRRITVVKQKIYMLQRVKAEKHCFE